MEGNGGFRGGMGGLNKAWAQTSQKHKQSGARRAAESPRRVLLRRQTYLQDYPGTIICAASGDLCVPRCCAQEKYKLCLWSQRD